ncbi:[protein-PII] uridylyltransferase [Thiomicrorhabdus sp. 6S3-12]|uniref:[protein-PII] uridylyltransferase n=1 Tax=Thiomicrorhabdus sp. 6S3-12 TaxID=2819681 RepID=UPI001AACC684|nr:[protein-PII] uridylyltransferase [Thiomicrorhabdus sp. 6S3-12]MBO1924985.1 [protein-PII] uridylyltransferase [Thiomicrorhabdus sp. 6S3-12]
MFSDIHRPSLPQFISALLDPEMSNLDKIKAGRNVIQRFVDYQFKQYEAGAPVSELLKERASFVDQILKKIWSNFVQDPDAALIAVGGYGRGELHPYSDIDLLVIAENSDKLQSSLSEFITFLWDLGFDVGHSIRSLDDCYEEGLKDVTTATNLLEARWITGNYQAFQSLISLWARNDFWPIKEFFSAKLEEQRKRHHRFQDTTYQLEPNIKESPGGLRDIHMINWVAKRYFRVKSFNELVQRNFLTTEEYVEIEAANKYLNRIRFALQHLKRRREERLQFDFQQQIASEFGYQDNPEKMAVEQFMSSYYRNVQSVVKLNEILLQHFREELFEPDEATVIPINNRFCIRNDYLDITSEDVFSVNPTAIFEMFVALANLPHINGLRSTAIRSIRDHLHYINEQFRADPINKALFIEIFRQPKGVYASIKRMHSYGILDSYLPVFKKISGLMQFNIFHAYTVDDHTILVIRNLRRFFVDDYAYEFPTAHQIAKQICRPEVLFLAGLFHDIAKGRKGEHEIVGAEDAAVFTREHNLPVKDQKMISWLVRYHLEFSHVAQRKDLSDPKTINEFASLMGDQEHLNHLYLLTVADVCATSNDVWNDWKNSLFLELYNETSKALALSSNAPKNKAMKALQTQEKAKEQLSQREINYTAYQPFWDSMADSEFFSRQSPNSVSRITEQLFLADRNQIHVMVRAKSPRGASELLIYMPDRDYLFANITSALDRLKMDIMEARIFSSNDGMTLVIMYFLTRDEHQAVKEQDTALICDTIRKHMLGDGMEPVAQSNFLNRRIRCFETPTEIHIEKLNEHRSELHISTKDAPGLLSRIGFALRSCHIRLHDARITTVGEKAEDWFIISDTDDKAITASENQARLRDALIETIED